MVMSLCYWMLRRLLELAVSHGGARSPPRSNCWCCARRSGCCDDRCPGRGSIEAVNIALWRIDCFNQIVQQLADFNVLHAAEIADRDLPQPRREAIARAARAISTMLHLGGIGDASWYSDLKAAMEKNIDDLVNRPL